MTSSRRRESGAAVVDFALVSVLVCFLALGVLQLALALHVRNTLTWCASEGARYGARAGSSPDGGAQRARTLIEQSLAPAYAQDVTARLRTEDGVTLVEVQVHAPLPLVAWWGPDAALTARGHAFAEVPG